MREKKIPVEVRKKPDAWDDKQNQCGRIITSSGIIIMNLNGRCKYKSLWTRDFCF